MKIDITDAYEQICIKPSDIWKMAFAMIYCTYASNTILMVLRKDAFTSFSLSHHVLILSYLIIYLI
jgi:hypothetical protein